MGGAGERCSGTQKMLSESSAMVCRMPSNCPPFSTHPIKLGFIAFSPQTLRKKWFQKHCSAVGGKKYEGFDYDMKLSERECCSHLVANAEEKPHVQTVSCSNISITLDSNMKVCLPILLVWLSSNCPLVQLNHTRPAFNRPLPISQSNGSVCLRCPGVEISQVPSWLLGGILLRGCWSRDIISPGYSQEGDITILFEGECSLS